jgi:cytochrome c5
MSTIVKTISPARRTVNPKVARLPLVVATALAAIVLVCVTALAGVAAPGKAKPPPAQGDAAKKAAGAAKAQHGAGGNEYGRHKVTICHKGKTMGVPAPAVGAHLKHGDKLDPC